MTDKLMILPSNNNEKTKLLRMPDDYEEHEVYRLATGIIAGIEERTSGYDWEDILEALEEAGFSEVPFTLGPEI
ncbi:MAG: hypothetical protein OQL09_00095 [Gammaproteobacteria bacterium]|nr:hypothetical protein [Gammaproteobacteria bacterium]